MSIVRKPDTGKAALINALRARLDDAMARIEEIKEAEAPIRVPDNLPLEKVGRYVAEELAWQDKQPRVTNLHLAWRRRAWASTGNPEHIHAGLALAAFGFGGLAPRIFDVAQRYGDPLPIEVGWVAALWRAIWGGPRGALAATEGADPLDADLLAYAMWPDAPHGKCIERSMRQFDTACDVVWRFWRRIAHIRTGNLGSGQFPDPSGKAAKYAYDEWLPAGMQDATPDVLCLSNMPGYPSYLSDPDPSLLAGVRAKRAAKDAASLVDDFVADAQGDKPLYSSRSALYHPVNDTILEVYRRHGRIVTWRQIKEWVKRDSIRLALLGTEDEIQTALQRRTNTLLTGGRDHHDDQ